MKKYLTTVIAVLLVTAMTAAACISGEREILFPEIAAIAAGAFCAPQLAWNVSLRKMLLLLIAGALTGAAIVLLPIAFPVQMCLAYLIASLMLLYSRTGFAPMISAVVLPVMLQSRGMVYPVSAAVLSVTVVLLRVLLERRSMLKPAAYHPEEKPDAHALHDLAIRWMCGSAVILLAVLSGRNLLAVPPLLVAFTEFWKPSAKAQQHPVKVSALIGACAGTGALLRYAAMQTGFPEYLAACVTITAVLVLMHKTGMYLPPAAALSVLAYLIPASAVPTYPLLVLCGTLLFLTMAILHGRITAFRAGEHAHT